MFTEAKKVISGTDWERFILPSSKTAHEVMHENNFQVLSKSAVETLPTYETFFNEIFPAIHWEDEVPF